MPKTTGQQNADWTVEETLLALELLLRHLPAIPGRDHPDVKALSAELRRLPIHPPEGRTPTFRNKHGVGLKLQNLYALHPEAGKDRKELRFSRTDAAVWDRYADDPDEVKRLAAQIRLAVDGPIHSPSEEEEDSFFEGRLLTRRHKRRERARGLRKKVIAKGRKLACPLRCDGCNQESLATDLGTKAEEAAFEVHHLVPLSELGETKTRLADVALLCANCHRLIHHLCRERKEWLNLAALRSAIGRS